jgi:chemosensory pili system protein ChpA (sensor histidine kinase/response regulator)
VSTAASAADAGFDLGPLTWVKGEIEQSLARGLVALEQFAAQPDELMHLRHAQTHHPSGLPVRCRSWVSTERSPLLEEVERHLVLLESRPASELVQTHVAAIGAACRRLARYLNELTEGEPPVTLKLYPDTSA